MQQKEGSSGKEEEEDRHNSPMNLGLILKQPQRNRMHRRISPPLIKEPARPIQMIKIILIRPPPPKRQLCNLKIAPKMARAVPMGLFIMPRPRLTIDEPLHRVVGVQVLWVRGEELDGLGPERGDRFRRIVQVDVEAVGFVVVLHVAEDVVVDVAEELDLGLDAPVVEGVLEGGVVVEEAAVPAAHLVVGFFAGVLHVVFAEDFGAFFVEVVGDPGWGGPVFRGDEFVVALRFGEGLGAAFEFFGKGDFVEEGPGVVEFVVPVLF
jgi:hypothetical protein